MSPATRYHASSKRALIEQAKRFFAAEHDWKMRYYIGKSTAHRGYVPEGEEVFAGGKHDRKEAFDTGRDLPADDPDVRAGTPMLGPNSWPEQAGFREAVGGYYEAAFELGRALFRGFSLALGLPEQHFDQYLRKPPSQLRLIHYPLDPSARRPRPASARIPTTNASRSCCRPRPDLK